MKKFHILIGIILSFTLMTLISGCGGGTSSTPTGTLSLSMTDAPPKLEGNVTEVNIAVIGIEYNYEGNWISAEEFVPKTFNLLDLQNGKSLHLGDLILPAGHYQEIRFKLAAPKQGANQAEIQSNPDCNITFENGDSLPLFVPSGAQSGYKGKGAFDITADAKIALTADFDVHKAIVVTGKSENNTKYILKPVIRLVVTELSGVINGNVVDVADYNKTTDSLVVYTYEDGAYNTDELVPNIDGIIFEKSISSSDVNMTDGNFTLAFLEEGIYTLVTALYKNNVFDRVVDEEDNVEVLKGQATSVDLNTSDYPLN